jgi:predicted RNase H-like nuclease
MPTPPKNPNFILTYTNISFDPTEPAEEHIRIEDIAHALSMMTRANGHFKTFYSVAQHSINCCLEAKARGYSKKVRLACLLHDAAEAYLCDVTRPVKSRLPEYHRIEENMLCLLYRIFGLDDLTEEDLRCVRDIDDAFLHHEFLTLHGSDITGKTYPLSAVPDFSEQPRSVVEHRFLSLFRQLSAGGTGEKCIGIDGCRGGWICAILDNGTVDIRKFASVADIFNEYEDFAACLIDIPIGLRSSPSQHRPDDDARALIRERGPTIFPAPCRQAVHAPSVAAAYEENERVLGKKLTPLTVGILPKIRETDDFLRHHPEYKNRLLESHPEVCFAALAGATLLTKKDTQEGQFERLSLLCTYTDITLETLAMAKDLRCAGDDILDAVCLAVSAGFAARGQYRTIPETPASDDEGLLMQMIAPRLP